MLELRNINFTVPTDEDDLVLIDECTLSAERPHFMAIVGPSGCGKSTLLKLVAGINEHSEGNIRWNERDVEEDGDLEPTEVAYVPQFSIAYDPLTVTESVMAATRLRVRGNQRRLRAITRNSLEMAGLWDIRDRYVSVLSGGQKRRLSLAMELVANPDLLLCDEVTSGLDPKSEQDITKLLKNLSRQGDGRLVINVTHSLSGLSTYDSVLVLFGGHIAYHGPPRALKHYFSVDDAEDVYPCLSRRKPAQWGRSWAKNRDGYYALIKRDQENEEAGIAIEEDDEADKQSLEEQMEQAINEAPPTISLRREVDPDKLQVNNPEGEDETENFDEDDNESSGNDDEDEEPQESIEELINAPIKTPGLLTQTFVQLNRRWKIFARDKTQLILHLAMLIGFPILVAIFALDGVPEPRQSSLTQGEDLQAEFIESSNVFKNHLQVGGLVSGLVMFQVILLTLMGSNNSAREIAGERQIFEKEKFAGLLPSSYLLSKILFLSVLVLAQAFWMCVFVELVTKGLPGDIGTRLLLLVLVNAAMTSVCLAISALLKSPEQSSLLSIYLVGFQLPLSGAILALPDWIAPVVRPLISAFWSWSGSLSSMSDTKFYDAVKRVTDTEIVAPNIAIYVLLCHLVIGLVAAYIGCRRQQWAH